MNTDRELLELAAKAAGMDYLIWTPGAAPLVPVEHRVSGRLAWHPLTDDGDALRLAVKLGIGQIHHKGWGQVMHPNFAQRMDFHYGDDQFDATRRAIVIAAADLGRSLP
jgi:hypothetical protein